MKDLKSVLAVVAAAFPVLYCGYLLYYFLDVSGGSMQEVETNGLAPTLIGLGVIALLFCIPLGVKFVRMVGGPRSPGSAGGAGTRRQGPDSENSFDADAVVARYMAQRQVEAVSGTPTAPPAQAGTKHPGFGRKAR